MGPGRPSPPVCAGGHTAHLPPSPRPPPLLASRCSYNLKSKMKGLPVVDEEGFRAIPARDVKALLENYD